MLQKKSIAVMHRLKKINYHIDKIKKTLKNLNPLRLANFA